MAVELTIFGRVRGHVTWTSGGAKFLDHGFVESGHRSEGPGDEVQLVLDDQARRRDVVVAVRPDTEE